MAELQQIDVAAAAEWEQPVVGEALSNKPLVRLSVEVVHSGPASSQVLVWILMVFSKASSHASLSSSKQNKPTKALSLFSVLRSNLPFCSLLERAS